jgi:putative N6-adenine-specific DNA methylase
LKNSSFKLIAKTFAGLEEVLASELKSLGAKDVQALKRAVSFSGDQSMLYRANLWSRAALSILRPMYEFRFETQQEFYDKMREFRWDEFFSVDKSFAISTVAIQSVFANTHFLALRSKDAIVDYFRDKNGKCTS